jgi:hypothetical protein
VAYLVQKDVQVQLSHAGYHRLLGLGVEMNAEGHVLGGVLVEEIGQLVFLFLDDSVDGDDVDGLGQLERLERNRRVDRADGIVGLERLALGDDADVSRAQFVDLLELLALGRV